MPRIDPPCSRPFTYRLDGVAELCCLGEQGLLARVRVYDAKGGVGLEYHLTALSMDTLALRWLQMRDAYRAEIKVVD